MAAAKKAMEQLSPQNGYIPASSDTNSLSLGMSMPPSSFPGLAASNGLSASQMASVGGLSVPQAAQLGGRPVPAAMPSASLNMPSTAPVQQYLGSSQR